MGTRKLLLIAVVGLLMFTVSINAFAADRGRILSTQEQQYQNMVLNGSLEAFSAGINNNPDGFTAEGLNTGTGTVARDATSKFQTYGVKLTQTNAAGTYTLKYNSAVTNFGNSLTGDSADLTTTEWQRLALYSNNGYVASAWVKLPGGAVNPTAVTLKSASDGKLYIEIDSDATGDYCYIDGFQITQGPTAPAFVNSSLTDSPDTGTQVVYGNIKAQDPTSTNYVQMVSTGTLNVGANVSLTSTGTLDLGAGANDDLTAADIAELTDTGTTTLHTHTGLAPGIHATQHMSGDDKVYWNSLSKANGDATSVTSQITSDITTHAAIAGAHHAAVTVTGAGLDLSGQQVSLDVAPSAGNATLIEEEDALQIKYNTSHLTEAGTGLELASAYATGSVYDTRFVNVSGTESMEGPLTIGKTYSSLAGIDIAAQISPVLDQSSAGAAGYTAFLVKATETALAGYTGTKLLLDLQAGASPASKLNVDNGGSLTTVGNIALSTASATVDGVNLDNALTDLTQGAGITISGGPGGHTRTIANADTGSAQLIFKNITDGTNTAAADTNSDTFTLTSANTMLGIAVNASTDVATFTIVPGNIDHGSLADLGANDHTQYPLKASIESITGAWTFSNDLTVNSSAITTDALTVKAEALTTGNLIKGRINLNVQAEANIMKITDTAATPINKFIIDRTGAITVGTIPFDSVTSKPTFVNSVTGGGGVTVSPATTGNVTLDTSATVSNTTATYTSGNAYSLIQHMQAIGKGTISADNAHGLRYDDVDAASSGHNHDSVYINDGAGEIDNANDFGFGASTFISNLDSDFLDGQHGAYYLNTSSGAQTKTGNVTFTGNVIMGDNATDTVILASQAATDATVADSPTLYLRGAYDSNTQGGAVTSSDYDATIVHNLLTTGPTSEIDFNIAGATKMAIDNSGNFTTAGTINSQTIGATSTFAALNATGELKVGGGYGSTGITMSTDGNLDMDGNLHIAGNLLVDGDQVILNVQTMEVESNKVLMNRNVTGAPVLNAAIEVERGDSPNTVIRWNEAPGYDRWELTNDGTNYLPMAGDITAQYLVNSASDVLTSEIVTSALPQNLTIKGDATSRTITFGKSAGNSDVINLDVSNANLQVRGAQIATTNLSDGANVAHVNAIETITANWVNTDFPWADNEVANDLTISGGTVNNTIIGGSQAAAATFTSLTATGTLAFPDNSVSMADIDWNAGQILITPDYPNASLYADGSSNNGTLALKNTDDANWRNYYEWTSQVTTLQDYTIVERYVLPPDFSSWSATNAIKLGFVTQTAVATDNKVDVIVYKSGSATLVYQTLANVSTGWTELVISSANLIGTTWAAGDIVVIKIILYSKSGNFARIGDVTLNYTR